MADPQPPFPIVDVDTGRRSQVTSLAELETLIMSGRYALCEPVEGLNFRVWTPPRESSRVDEPREPQNRRDTDAPEPGRDRAEPGAPAGVVTWPPGSGEVSDADAPDVPQKPSPRRPRKARPAEKGEN